MGVSCYNYCYWFVGGDFVTIEEIPLPDLWFILPDDIKVVLGVILTFLIGLAVWRIIK